MGKCDLVTWGCIGNFLSHHLNRMTGSSRRSTNRYKASSVRRYAPVLAILALAIIASLAFVPAAFADTETLNPDGAGTVSDWTYVGGSTNFTNLQQPDDEDTTYADSTISNNQNHTVSLNNPSSVSGTINSITVWVRVRHTGATEDLEHMIYYDDGGTPTSSLCAADAGGSEFSPTASYADYSCTWTQNPTTLTNWSLADVNSLEAGIETDSMATSQNWTSVWVVVDYTPAVAPTVDTPTKASIDDTTAVLGATIVTNGGSPIVEYGTVWGLSSNPTGNKTIKGTTDPGAVPFSNSVSGITEGSLIYYRGYATNSEGTGYSSDDSFYSEPIQVSDLTFSNITTGGMRINWTNNSAYQGALVVVSTDASAPADPTDGATYTASSTYGTGGTEYDGAWGYAVYSGTGSAQVDVSNLASDTTYYVYVYAYAGPSNDNYQQTLPLNGSQATSLIPPSNVAPTSLVNGTVGTYYSTTFTADGDTPITWNVSAGALPDGMSLDTNTGLYNGTPTTDGTFNFSITATNTGGTDGRAYTHVIEPVPFDTLSSSNTQLAPSSVDAGSTDVVMQRIQVDSDSVGDGSIDITSIDINDTGVAGSGHWTSLQIYHSEDNDFLTAGDNTLVGSVAAWDGTATNVTLTGATVTSADSDYLFIVYNVAGAAEGLDMRSVVSAFGVSAPDSGETGLSYTSGAATMSINVDSLSSSNSSSAPSETDAGSTDVVMQRVQLDSSSTGSGSIDISSIQINDAGTAGSGHWASVQVYYSEDDSYVTTGDNTLAGSVTSWDGSRTTVPLSGATVTSADSDYLFIVYNVAEAAEGETMRAIVEALNAAVPDTGQTGLVYDSGIMSVNSDTLSTSNPTAIEPTGDEAPGTTGIQMLYFQVDSDTAGSNSVELSSLTVADIGNATTADIDTVSVYIDTDTTFTGSTLIGSASFTTDPLTVTLSSGTVAQRTVTNGTPKYVFVTYDLNASATDGKTIKADVTDVDVASPDSGVSSLSGYQSNTLTIGGNTAPTITSSGAPSVAENQTSVIDVQSTDDNDSEGSGLSYSITGGADQTEFSLDTDTGVLTFQTAPDYENPSDDNMDNDYVVIVRVTDSGALFEEQTITVTVTDDPNDATTAGTATAVAASNTTIGVTMPYTDDNNDNNTYTVEYKLSSAGSYTTWVDQAANTPSPYTTTITGLVNGATYDVSVLYEDLDGVNGTAGQVIYSITLPIYKTMTGTASAVSNGRGEVDVTMPYTYDDNSDNTYTVDYKLSSEPTVWTNWVAGEAHTASPFTNTITGLEADKEYDVRLTYNDTDGIIGINPQIINNILTRARILTVTDASALDPSDNTPCPGAEDVVLDIFDINNIVTSVEDVDVSAVTLSLTGNTHMYDVYIECGGAPYDGSVTSPSSTPTVTFNEAITISRDTTVSCSIKANLNGAGDGSVNAQVTGITSNADTIDSITDTGGTQTVRIQGTDVPIISNFDANDGELGQSTLSWENPNDADLTMVEVRRKEGSYPTTLYEGTSVYSEDPATQNATRIHSDTGLTNGTTYYYVAFVKGASCPILTVTEGSNADTATPGPTAPTVSTPTKSSIDETTATLGATIVINGSAAISEYGTVWGTSPSPTGNKTIKGTNDPSTVAFTNAVSDLPEGSLVYYRGYATNSQGTGYSADDSFYTEPTQVSDILFSNIADTSMRISWTVNSGSSGVIVTVDETSDVPTDPVDGTTYTADSDMTTFTGSSLGTSSVVYVGTGPLVDLAGLTNSTTYYVAVYAYAGTGSEINYQQTSPATGSQTTTAGTAPDPPTGISLSQMKTWGPLINWNTVSNATTYNIYRSTDNSTWSLLGSVDHPTSSYRDSAAPYSNTKYWWTVTAENGSGESTKPAGVAGRTALKFQWNMISAPYNTTGMSATQVFGSWANWSWYWNSSSNIDPDNSGTWVQNPTIQPGYSIWIWAYNDSTVLSYSGSANAAAVIVTVVPGWNLISNQLTTNMDTVDTIWILDEGTGGEKSLRQAIIDGDIGGTLYWWDGTTHESYTVVDDIGVGPVVAPWKGFWILNLDGVNHTLTIKQ